MDKVELDFGCLELRQDGVLYWKPKSGLTSIKLEELKQMLEAAFQLTNNQPRPFLSDNRQYESLGFAERQFVGDNLHRFASAVAILESSPIVRFISHTINQFFSPRVEMQMFKTEEEAILWLLNTSSD